MQDTVHLMNKKTTLSSALALFISNYFMLRSKSDVIQQIDDDKEI